MSYTSDINLALYNYAGLVENEMSNFICTGQMGNFIFCPVIYIVGQV